MSIICIYAYNTIISACILSSSLPPLRTHQPCRHCVTSLRHVGTSLHCVLSLRHIVASRDLPHIGSACDSVSADIVFVVDSSGSIQDGEPEGTFRNWQQILNFIIGIIQSLDVSPTRNRIGMVTFGNEGRNQFFLNDFADRDAIIERVNRTEYFPENTNTSGGLRVMREDQFTMANGDRDDRQNIAIVITDGKSTYDSNLTIPEAELAHDAGIIIFGVGVTDSIDVPELRAISSATSSSEPLLNKNYFLSAEFANINTVMDALIQETCEVSTEGKWVVLYISLYFF